MTRNVPERLFFVGKYIYIYIYIYILVCEPPRISCGWAINLIEIKENPIQNNETLIKNHENPGKITENLFKFRKS